MGKNNACSFAFFEIHWYTWRNPTLTAYILLYDGETLKLVDKNCNYKEENMLLWTVEDEKSDMSYAQTREKRPLVLKKNCES